MPRRHKGVEALYGDVGSAPRPGRLSLGIDPGTHWIGGWVGPRAGLKAVEKGKILPCRESNPARPACRYND
jgi:hypothetical protein